ncbi:MAG: hypothetical protein F2644_02105 [Actinobacteria bacterium]|nr:hypothetical protein [Actinomycetota bacterium]
MTKPYSFDDFLNEHVGSVTLYTKATCGISHLVDDIVQETFIRAWRYYPTLRAESSSRSWIISICRNTIRGSCNNCSRYWNETGLCRWIASR